MDGGIRLTTDKGAAWFSPKPGGSGSETFAPHGEEGCKLSWSTAAGRYYTSIIDVPLTEFAEHWGEAQNFGVKTDLRDSSRAPKQRAPRPA